jgi:hypothetical protein
MRLQRLVLLAAAFGAVSACDDGSDVIVNNPGPLAYVRYVHAMPDTGTVDVRIVDQVVNLNCYNVPYRSVCPYAGVPAGNRHFTVFTASAAGNINVVTNAILDTTIALTANTYYTIVHSGFARTGQTPFQRFCLITDDAGTVTAGRFKVRTIVAAPGFTANQDVHLTTATNAAAGPAPAAGSTAIYTAANVTAAAACPTPTAWVERDTVPSSTANGGAATLWAYNAGTATPATANVSVTLLSGAPASGVATAVAGSRISGSALTAFLFPAGVAGSQAAGAATAQQAIDKRP